VSEQPRSSQGEASSRVEKVIRIVASSPTSWADAARNAIAEASKSMHGLSAARLVDTDVLVRGSSKRYRVKLEIQFQIDRNRTDAHGMHIQVRRFLIVANQTLANAGLERLVHEKIGDSAAEFHVLVPHAIPSSNVDRSGLMYPNMEFNIIESHNQTAEDAAQRLESFKLSFANLGTDLTTEIAAGDPVAAIRRVMERSSFDEIILSTLPVGVSRWLKLDLPSRIERAFDLPLTTLVQHETGSR